MISLTNEQQRAYDRFIRARDKMRMGVWIRPADVQSTVDLMGFNRPFYEENIEYLEYKEAFAAWLAVEPQFRHGERMRASRGDYDKRETK